MKRQTRTQSVSSVVFLLVLVLSALYFRGGWNTPVNWIAFPVMLLFFFLTYLLDVKIGHSGHYNMDHVLAFPAAVFFGNPVAIGLMAVIGFFFSRWYRNGKKAFNLRTLFSGSLAGASLTVGCGVYLLASSNGHNHPVQDFGFLLMAMFIGMVANWIGFFFGVPLKLPSRAEFKQFSKPFVDNFRWIILSSPFVAIVVDVTMDRRYFFMFLGFCTLLVTMWALHLSSGLEERTAALAQATGRQELLQQLAASGLDHFDDRNFLEHLFAGLKEYVPWTRGVLMAVPPKGNMEPILVGLEAAVKDEGKLRETLEGLLEEAGPGSAVVRNIPDLQPLLLNDAGSQLVAAISTRELAFGVVAMERAMGSEPFSSSEAQFVNLVFGELARPVQDDILKRQLITTNRKLRLQTNYLSQILHISNLLKVHLNIQSILDKVAKGIREALGFNSVLISLYNEDEEHFERMAQAGIDEIWDKVKAQKPPASEIFSLLQDKYKVGECYFVSHTEATISPYDVIPAKSTVSSEPGDWDPLDGLFVPLVDKNNRLLGIISVDEPSDGKIPTMETLNALEVLANQTVNALENAQIHAKTRRKAVMDALTGLYNHGYFQETLANMGREHTESGQPYTILMMDLDNFKQVNDTYGHLVGDEVLKAVAPAINSCIRRGDISARYGGEEFAVLLPHCDHRKADVIAERIRNAVAAITLRFDKIEETVQVTLSIGMASYPDHGEGHRTILEKADHALYDAKRHGKNRVFLFK